MKTLFLLCCFLLAACPLPTPVPPPVPDVIEDGGARFEAAPELGDSAAVEAGDGIDDDCGRAWVRISVLSCVVTAPTTGTWLQACRRARAHAIDMHTKCVEKATNCPVVNGCLSR